MRLFITTFAKVYNYKELQNDINNCFEGKWTSTQNLHLTFKFLGEIQNPKEIITALKNLKYPKNLKIEFDELKLFEGRKKVLYMTTTSKEILDIEKEISKRFSYLNIQSKEFIPHLTLLRIKKIINPNYQQVLKNYENKPLGSTDLKVVLIKSTVTKDGPIYELLEEF